MQLEVHPPFPGALPPGQPGLAPRRVGIATILGSLALAAVGIGFGAAGLFTRRHHGRLICAGDEPIVGVRLDYPDSEGQWWRERGRRLYWKARRAGANTADDIARRIIAAELGEDSHCLAQFPPHDGTYQQNVNVWNGMRGHVVEEMAAERANGR